MKQANGGWGHPRGVGLWRRRPPSGAMWAAGAGNAGILVETRCRTGSGLNSMRALFVLRRRDDSPRNDSGVLADQDPDLRFISFDSLGLGKTMWCTACPIQIGRVSRSDVARKGPDWVALTSWAIYANNHTDLNMSKAEDSKLALP